VIVEAPPQIPPQIIVQTAAPAAPAPPPHTAEALVVELRGDHWVRLTAYGAAEIPSAAQNLPVAAKAATGNRNTTATEAARLPLPARSDAAQPRLATCPAPHLATHLPMHPYP